jgi:hypothetical protein
VCKRTHGGSKVSKRTHTRSHAHHGDTYNKNPDQNTHARTHTDATGAVFATPHGLKPARAPVGLEDRGKGIRVGYLLS